MHRLALLTAFAFGTLTGCALLATEGGRTALEVIAPLASDAVTKLVKERWGPEAEVDIKTAACVPAPPGSADWFGDDDDDEFEYALCKGKAIE